MQKRQRDTHKSADRTGPAPNNLCAPKRHRLKGAYGTEASPFDRLPDELVLAILAALNDPRTLAAWAQTSRRHQRLANDPFVWRRLCELRFGPLLHHQFSESSKDWRWLYRAQAHVATLVGADVGAVLVNARNHDYVYWGDCRDGRPHGYGLAILLPTRHCERERALTRARPASAAPPPEETFAGYEGMWRDGRMCGHGVYTTSDGRRYDGQWRDDQRNGIGTYTQPGGFKYEGHWRDDRCNGHGVYTWPKGARHDGEFRNGKRDGRGTYVYADIERHEGHWKNDVRHGHGTTTFGDGDHYAGDHADGKFNGYGVYTWADGTRYDGQWQHGEANGVGTRHYPDGSCVRGQWTGGSLVWGEVVCHRSGGAACHNGPRCAACMAVTTAQVKPDTHQSTPEQ
ncbi:Morn repeat domain containing protein [Pandoravirus salinus]|uniref:Morn repeat domain containing protein n=1 Tax=Pandoravirus salinus TaxID=1349410 RepID=S4VWY3_9VIRU|nr:morn repeat domain [Pandoravirus salinus]AGO84883.1 Morn repeat domain containing protein [Pandoravirus salinus]